MKENHIGLQEIVGVCQSIKSDIDIVFIVFIGEEWGEKGYIRILRGENICGIGSQVYQPIISTVTTTLDPKSTTSSGMDKFYYRSNKILFSIFMFYTILYRIY